MDRTRPASKRKMKLIQTHRSSSYQLSEPTRQLCIKLSCFSPEVSSEPSGEQLSPLTWHKKYPPPRYAATPSLASYATRSTLTDRASNDFPRVRSQLSSNSSVLALTVASTVNTLLEHVNFTMTNVPWIGSA